MGIFTNHSAYPIYLVIRWELTLPLLQQICKTALKWGFRFKTVPNSAIKLVFCFQNNPKDLDPSYKMDLDL